ncbi:hypothetical protein FVE85_8892 [Porphyridium purpureum]|uniref:Heme oxygenase 1, chloroplastic n=1 Tax=Porphyridium purpureum TaxID=35688 RepID=A0A5J4YSN6_PORPP|nr:hypothetical protein FVE85_8892 [Porphyridium purpureum]|eukprot:POR4869..scf296_7
MGSFAKRLGQLATRSMESESAAILRTSRANKMPGSLSAQLDATLRTAHDMKVFGLGTAASLASAAHYARFTQSMCAVYGAMEAELDRSPSPANRLVWDKFKDVLRRAPALRLDLCDVSAHLPVSGADEPKAQALPRATEEYISTIRSAADEDARTNGARMLAHMYCRYFADLFGGQMVGTATRVALRLPAGTPRHYVFQYESTPPSGGGAPRRKLLIEGVYETINAAGVLLDENARASPHSSDAREDVVAACRTAFACNVKVYRAVSSSQGMLLADAARGCANAVIGFTRGRR